MLVRRGADSYRTDRSIMPLFYFHFFDGETLEPDDFGVEFASTEEACLEAFAAAREMWGELLRTRRDPSRCAFDIGNEAEDILLRVNFSELTDACGGSEFQPGFGSAELVRSIEQTARKAASAQAELKSSLALASQRLAESRSLLEQLSVFAPARPGTGGAEGS